MDNSLVDAIIAEACSAFLLQNFIISQCTIFVAAYMMMQVFSILICVTLILV
jgi:hypothetical protein